MDDVDLILRRMGDSPDQNMAVLLQTLRRSTIVPVPDKYYTYVYKAKTRNIRYDQHPLIQCLNVYRWGFTGANVHWGSVRQYSWNEVLSNMYEVSPELFEALINVPLARFKNT